MRPLNRVDRLLLPPDAYQTYALVQPRSHFRDVSCAAFGCDAHLNGWTTAVDERTELGQRQVHYIRTRSGRKFTEYREEGGRTVFRFEAGQQCFRSTHRMPVREPLYLVGRGDWRTFHPQTARRVPGARAWIDDFGENQERLADRRNRG